MKLQESDTTSCQNILQFYVNNRASTMTPNCQRLVSNNDTERISYFFQKIQKISPTVRCV